MASSEIVFQSREPLSEHAFAIEPYEDISL